MDEQLFDARGADAAILVELFAAGFGHRFDSAFNRNAMRAAEQVERLFIPEINAGLKTDVDGPLSNGFEQLQDVFPDAEDLIDEINVINAPRDERLNFRQHRFHAALAKLIPKKGLVAEGASPRASAGELELCTAAFALKNVVPIRVQLNGIIAEVERSQLLHIGDCKLRADMKAAIVFAPATAGNF